MASKLLTNSLKPVYIEKINNDKIWTIVLNRPKQRNAVNGPTAQLLHDAFMEFNNDATAQVAVLFGDHGTFCAGADLKAVASKELSNPVTPHGIGPMGPSRMELSKPVIAAVSGYAVAGGLELACWCDLRVAEQDAIFGVFCRRWGVPLIDGGTVRLPRLIGHSRAMDMILTGRSVNAQEALQWGLANRVVAKGKAREEAELLAKTLCNFPQKTMLSDRKSVLEQWGLQEKVAMQNEFVHGSSVLRESVKGAAKFSGGSGRGGSFDGFIASKDTPSKL